MNVGTHGSCVRRCVNAEGANGLPEIGMDTTFGVVLYGGFIAVLGKFEGEKNPRCSRASGDFLIVYVCRW